MSFDVEQHVRYRVGNAPMLGSPFPHFFLHPVFPEDFYAALRQHLPDLSAYQRLDETGTVAKGAYKERFVCSIEDLAERERRAGSEPFWHAFGAWLQGDAFAELLMDKFRSGIDERFGPKVALRVSTEVRLVRDFTNYAISPHTDKPSKLISLLFYLPADASMRHLGTSIYAPNDPEFRCDGTAHYRFEDFKRAAAMDYVPNALFAFLRTDQAFHGVPKIGDANIERDVLLYNIYVDEVVARTVQEPRNKRRWPWQRA
jgi:hypothetical protein